MKRLFLFGTIVFWALGLMAEDMPAGFYDSITGKKDSVLKTTLSLLVRGGERYEYGPNQYHSTSNPPEWEKGDFKAYGTWQALPLTDIHPDGIIWDMYSKSVRYFPNKQGESGCSLNIEHCLPKSWWGWNKDLASSDPAWIAYKDLYNLNPSDQRANSQKSNYAPGHVKKGDKFNNGSFKMDAAKSSGYGYICWEPAEEYRGDFARAYFYMATAYEYLTWTAYSQYISNASYLMFSDSIQKVLLDWHREDPVSDKEICRADRISDIQHNRNPFIDYPELVEYIWGNKKGEAVDLSSLTCTAGTVICPEPIIPTPEPQLYDTLINLPAITAALVNAVSHDGIQGSANSGIQSNGTASITMGKSSTDGEISFTGINLTDTAVLAFRASPYNSATSMQLEIYLNGSSEPFHTINVTVEQDTRNEVRYRITIPQNTTSIRMVSVGGSTSKRACMQEFYLLSPKKDTNPIATPEVEKETVTKVLRDGQLVIIRNNETYSLQGQRIQ